MSCSEFICSYVIIEIHNRAAAQRGEEGRQVEICQLDASRPPDAGRWTEFNFLWIAPIFPSDTDVLNPLMEGQRGREGEGGEDERGGREAEPSESFNSRPPPSKRHRTSCLISIGLAGVCIGVCRGFLPFSCSDDSDCIPSSFPHPAPLPLLPPAFHLFFSISFLSHPPPLVVHSSSACSSCLMLQIKEQDRDVSFQIIAQF